MVNRALNSVSGLPSFHSIELEVHPAVASLRGFERCALAVISRVRFPSGKLESHLVDDPSAREAVSVARDGNLNQQAPIPRPRGDIVNTTRTHGLMPYAPAPQQ